MPEPEFYIYDEETYPNIFSIGFEDSASDTYWEFEISDWRNDYAALADFVNVLVSRDAFAVGFNNVGFDYPVLHFLLEQGPTVTAAAIAERATAIIDNKEHNAFVIWENDRYLKQLDLQRIHHMEYNSAKATSLKAVEFAMRATNIGDLPYQPGTTLTYEQSRKLVTYMRHDIRETKRFFHFSWPQIKMRFEFSDRFNQNFLNDNEVKIGVKYFTDKLEHASPGSCYTRINGKREPRQTPRTSIPVADIVFPYIQFESAEFKRALAYFMAATIYNTRGGLSFEGHVDGVKYKLGSGGIHASVDRQSFFEDTECELVDIDVSGFYPAVAIANRLYPEHLGYLFCDAYAEVKAERKLYAKKTPENGMLKLASNGVYGHSNSEFSVFYDPKFTMSITINGQLLLLMLLDRLMLIPDIKLIQLNTDGVTVKCPRVQRDNLNIVVEWWQNYTRLDLEEVTYKQMHIRDVNNYIAESTAGKVKYVGAYDYTPAQFRTPIGWHQDFSSLVVAKCAEAVLLNGVDPVAFVHNHRDFMDFAIRGRATGKSHLRLVAADGTERPAQKITRYYVSQGGETLLKISPPPPGKRVGAWKFKNGLTDLERRQVPQGIELDEHGTPWDERLHTKNKSKYVQRVTNECAGMLVTDISNMADFPARPIDFDWYIAEVAKLTKMTAG